MKRSRLRVEGQDETAVIKREIQSVARDIVIARDRSCILRDTRRCNGMPGIPGVVLQADHLITRSNAATYADTRLIVCLCKSCHGWKSIGGNKLKAEYDALVKTVLSTERVGLWEACERDAWRPHRTSAMDWKLQLVALKAELARLG